MTARLTIAIVIICFGSLMSSPHAAGKWLARVHLGYLSTMSAEQGTGGAP
jgi:hypothetical protein